MEIDWASAWELDTSGVTNEGGDTAGNGSVQSSPAAERTASAVTSPASSTTERLEGLQTPVNKINKLLNGNSGHQRTNDGTAPTEIAKDLQIAVVSPPAHESNAHVDQIMLDDNNEALQLQHMHKQVGERLQIGRILDHYLVNDKILELKMTQSNGKPV